MSNADFNGLKGTVVSKLENERQQVQLDDGSAKRIKQVNFKEITESEPLELSIGCHVVLYGLSTEAFNGTMGMIASNTIEERNQVLMDDGSVKNIKPANICVIPRRTAMGVFQIQSTAVLEQIIKSDKLVCVNFT